MIKRVFEAIEGTTQAVTFLLILFMGAVIVGLAAFTTLVLAVRAGQLLWALFGNTKWI